MKRKVLAEARAILKKEIQALEQSCDALDDGFVAAIELIRRSRGKLVVTGIGKSGLIGQKIAATMSSTGTAAIFMHSVDALHGDLGMVATGDVVLALSHSGSSIELLDLVDPLRRIGARIVAMVGNTDSPLARAADCAIRIVAPVEADHLNLAPTASALAALAMGDALAGVLSSLRGFKPEDFALYHPGGAIGRRLLLHVRDLMHSGDDNPIVTPKAEIAEVLAELSRKRLGGVNVVDNRRSRRLVGIITEGDIRRALDRREEFFTLSAREMMTENPATVREDDKATYALELMENRPHQISVLPVLNRNDRVVGMLRVHDLLNASA